MSTLNIFKINTKYKLLCINLLDILCNEVLRFKLIFTYIVVD